MINGLSKWAVVIALCVVVSPSAGQTWIDKLPKAHVWWSADHEKEGLSQWSDGDAALPGGGVFDQHDSVAATLETKTVHSGQQAVRLTHSPGDDARGGAVYLIRWRDKPLDEGGSQSLPDRAYYSAWYHLPRSFDGDGSHTLMQFKSTSPEARVSKPTWSIRLARAEDKFFLTLHSPVNDPTDQAKQRHSPARPVVVGRWVHVEVFARFSEERDGRIAVWQDGVRIYDVSAVRTSLGGTNYWAVGLEASGDDAGPAAVVIDDAAITRVRTGRARGDVTDDGVVDVADLSLLGAQWGESGRYPANADLNGDGTVDVGDMALVGANWSGFDRSTFQLLGCTFTTPGPPGGMIGSELGMAVSRLQVGR